MKKLVCLLMVAVMLFGCAEAAKDDKSSSVKEEASHDMIDEVVSFETFDEFFGSEVCTKMKEEGFIPCEISYDTEKYQLIGIDGDSHFYDVAFKDVNTDERIIYSVTFDYNHDASKNTPSEEAASTISVEKNSKTYNLSIENHNGNSLSCNFDTGYKVYINPINKDVTQDKLLEYFDDFELVEVQEE